MKPSKGKRAKRTPVALTIKVKCDEYKSRTINGLMTEKVGRWIEVKKAA